MKDYSCVLIHCEHGEGFQEYVYDTIDGSRRPRVPNGVAVGVEITQNGKTEFFLLDGIDYSND